MVGFSVLPDSGYIFHIPHLLFYYLGVTRALVFFLASLPFILL